MEDSISYAVVKVLDEKNSNGKIFVELVPTSWILEYEEVTQCFWPSSHLKKDIQKWIKEEKSPSETWTKYYIEILETASNYEQGLRQLENSYKLITQFFSSESEGKLTVLSRSIGNQLLKQTNSLFNLSTIEENMERENDVVTGTLTKKSSKSADEQITVLQSQINDLKDAKNEILLSSITNSITSAKQSLQCDLDKKLEALKRCPRVESSTEKKPAIKGQLMAILKIFLPIKNLDNFLIFEDSLNLNKEENQEIIEEILKKQTALKYLYETLTAGSNNYKTDIKIILPNIITKTVQLQYSGTGRVVYGNSKKNFSQTIVYQCMKEFLEKKYVNSSTQMMIQSVTSRYLANASYRRGSYAMQKKTSANNID